MNAPILFTILSTACYIIATIPYLRDIFRGGTKPHSFTWLIWSITQSIGVAGIWYGDGGIGAIAPSVAVAIMIAVFCISLFKGTRDITRTDGIFLSLALLGIPLWLLLDRPLLAVFCVTAIDMLGYFPTYRKTYRDPWSETLSSWVLSLGANVFAILALQTYNLFTLFYLVAIASANGILVSLIFFRRGKQGP